MGVLWRFTGGQVSRHAVNVTCADLNGFTLILHCSSQWIETLYVASSVTVKMEYSDTSANEDSSGIKFISRNLR